MAKRTGEDLFEDTKMSFGEHLEELRVVLFRGVVGLLIGFLIGMAVAKQVVRWIESPLRNALEEYYLDTDVERMRDDYSSEMSEGSKKSLEEFMRTNRLTPEDVFVEVPELERLSRRLAEIEAEPAPDPAPADDDSAEEVSPADNPADVLLPPPSRRMLKTRVWRRIKTRITSLSAQEAFMIWLKASFISGLLIASPFIFWQIWTFVAAGLYPHEKNYVYIFLPFSLGLFWLGAGLAFFFVFEPVLDFLFSFNRAMEINPDPRISEWIGFVLFLPLGFGIAFQLPLVMLFLNRIGIFDVSAYLQKWRIAVLVIFVLAMFLTPADPISMMLLAAPLTILYFLGILLCRWMPRGRNPFDEGYDPN